MSWRKTITDAPRFEDTLPIDDVPKYEDTLPIEETSAVESALRGTAQGATLGFADEITGGLESLFTDKTYDQARDESRANYKAAEEANPISFGAGQLAGGVGAAFIPGLNVAKAATIGGRVGTAALGGAIAGLGTSQAEDAQGMAIDSATGAALGGGLQGAGEALVPASKWAGSRLGKALASASEKGSPFANEKLSRIAEFLSGVDKDAANRMIERPLQTAAAEADDFAFKTGQQAVAETEALGSKLGQEVGNAKNAFLERASGQIFPEAQVLKMRVEDFLRANQPSTRGFSAISPKERDELLTLKAMLDGPINGEDLVKIREHMDYVKRLAKKYDTDETGPVIGFLKGIRGQADGILDRAAPDVDAANQAFAQYKGDTGILRASQNESQAEGMISNLYGANKSKKQEAAARLFSPETMESAQDIAANKSFEAAKRPGGDNYFRRAALPMLTFGGSEVLTSPDAWKKGLRYVGRVEHMVKTNPQALGTYAGALTTAANRGPQALAATHFILTQRDPKYRALVTPSDEEQE